MMEESIKDVRFESTEQISLSRNDIISVAKDHNLELTEEEIEKILSETIKDLDVKVEELSDQWVDYVIKAIERELRLEVDQL